MSRKRDGMKSAAPITALIAALVLSACTTPVPPSRSEANRARIDAEFGAVELRMKDVLARHEDLGVLVVRGYSEYPRPGRFTAQVPEQFDQTLVLDAVVETRIEKDVPLYRIGIDPVKISPDRVALWPGYIVLETVAGLPRLVARLPVDRSVDDKGLIWTGWTYCPDCLGLKALMETRPETRDADFAALEQMRALAQAPAAKVTDGPLDIRFTVNPGSGVLDGRDAEKILPRAAALIDQAKDRVARMAPAREAYQALERDYRGGPSLRARALSSCGTYEPNRDPQARKGEEARRALYQGCVDQVVARYDFAQRADEISALRAREEMLANRAEIAQVDRFTIAPLDKEIEDAADWISHTGLTLPPRIAARMDPASGDDPDPAPVATTEKDKPTPAAEPVVTTQERSIVYLARVAEDAANQDLAERDDCLADIACQRGMVISLITVEGWCAQDDLPSLTQAGNGLVVERYNVTKDEKAALETAAEALDVAEFAGDDRLALEAGLAALRTYKVAGAPIYFASYRDFFEANHGEKNCSDRWRDSARHPVMSNPDIVFE